MERSPPCTLVGPERPAARPPAPDGRCPAPGFTLIELAMTIAIIGVVAALAIPRFYDQSVYEERGFAAEALAAIRFAQKRAIATGCDTRVSFTPGSYALTERSACTTGLYDQPIAHPSRPGDFAASAPTGVIITPAATFGFDRIGRPRSAIYTILTDVTRIDIGDITLEVHPQTGYARELP